MWTNENRVSYDRRDLRYQSNLTDAEWMLAELKNVCKNNKLIWGGLSHKQRKPDKMHGFYLGY